GRRGDQRRRLPGISRRRGCRLPFTDPCLGDEVNASSSTSKGIVNVVFRIAPDRGKSRHARRRGGSGQRPFLPAQTDENDEILDQILGIGRHRHFLMRSTLQRSYQVRLSTKLGRDQSGGGASAV